jgi:hypothetical protein
MSVIKKHLIKKARQKNAIEVRAISVIYLSRAIK